MSVGVDFHRGETFPFPGGSGGGEVRLVDILFRASDVIWISSDSNAILPSIPVPSQQFGLSNKLAGAVQ